jgi:hypothetical protein
MNRFMKSSVLALGLCVASSLAARADMIAATNEGFVASIAAKLEAIEFEFSRGHSEVPFLPVLSLSYTAYGKSTFQRVDGSGENVEYRSQYASVYAMVPLHIGRRDIVVAVPYVSHTSFNIVSGGLADQDVYSFNLPVGVVWQTPGGTQWGVLGMPCFSSPMTPEGDWADDFMAGVGGRRFSGDRSVWYYAIAYDYDFGANWVIPYVGYTHVIDPSWVFSLILPWPSISYAPSDSFYISLGVLPSGAAWSLRGEGDNSQAMSSLGGWDLGLYSHWRIANALWLSVGSGVSGLRSLEIENGDQVTFDQHLSSEPFVSVAIGLRPQ